MIEVQDLTMAFGPRVLQERLTFTVNKGEIFFVMGGSGTGKSTLLRHMVGLSTPAHGRVLYGETSFFESDPEAQAALRRRIGVMYQQGALWSAMTLLENVALPVRLHTALPERARDEAARLKLALVGLAGFEDFLPSALSGGMRKRAAIARALALDPEVLFLDEPSAGLDPVTSRRLDDLILELRDSLGATFVVVSHELASILAIADDSVFLDAESRTMIAKGSPKRLLEECRDERVHRFLSRSGDGGRT